jgi:Protein of unknown function (DUF2971)
MLLDRLYKASNNELIYHYCRAESFVEILMSQTMWHTAYHVLNDSMEREWGYLVFKKALQRLPSEIDSSFGERIDEIIKIAYRHSLVMLACYSLDADVLGQWRAYGDNGRGFALGFLPSRMLMPAKKLRVLYEEESQIQELVGNLKHTYDYEKSIGFKFDGEFQKHWGNVGLDLCAYKNPSFREEREIRLAHVSFLTPEGGVVPLGARDPSGRLRATPAEVKFRIRDGLVVPYMALDYTDGGENSPVKEVVLGPRNENEESNVRLFLNTLGLKDVSVRRSQVPYR